MEKGHPDSETETRCRYYSFPLAARVFYTQRLTGRIVHFLLHRSWNTDWNEKELNGFTMKGRSDDPSHQQPAVNIARGKTLPSDFI